MGFLTTQNGGSSGSGGSGVNIYTSPIDNTSFISDGGKFKATITHGLDTNNMIVQVEEGGMTEMVGYKYINDNEIEIYRTSASDVIVKVFGLQKSSNGSLSIIGMGVIGEMVLGKSK